MPKSLPLVARFKSDKHAFQSDCRTGNLAETMQIPGPFTPMTSQTFMAERQVYSSILGDKCASGETQLFVILRHETETLRHVVLTADGATNGRTRLLAALTRICRI
jgi:hypothetical protein